MLPSAAGLALLDRWPTRAWIQRDRVLPAGGNRAPPGRSGHPRPLRPL